MITTYTVTDLNDNRQYQAEIIDSTPEKEAELIDWYASELGTYIDMIKIEKL
jgi:hypothetical protein